MVFTGTLKKRGHVMPTWRVRFFSLNGNRLEYFTHEGGEKKGELIVTATTTLQEASFSSYPGAFVLRDSVTNSELYLFAENDSIKRSWVKVFENTINELKKPKPTPKTAVATTASVPAPVVEKTPEEKATVTVTSAESKAPPNPEVSAASVAAAAGTASEVASTAVDTAIQSTEAISPPPSPEKGAVPNEETSAPALPTPEPTPPEEKPAEAIEAPEVGQEQATDVVSKQDTLPTPEPTPPEEKPAEAIEAPEVGQEQATDVDVSEQDTLPTPEPTPPEEKPVEVTEAPEVGQEQATDIVVSEQDSSEIIGEAVGDDEDVEEVEVALEAAVLEEPNQKTDDELDAAMFATVKDGAWLLKREGEKGGVYHSRFVWIDIASKHLYWSKVQEKDAPSKSINLTEGFSLTDLKKSVKQRRASIMGTADEGGYAFTIVDSADSSRSIGLKLTDEEEARVWRSAVEAVMN